ncbi:Hypothetical protein A7982_09899 [Minicystis rosea]|nr:Hypothetical protein A7982_09899 [Minicystis rosea]
MSTESPSSDATPFLEKLAGTDRVTVLDGECVDAAADYEHVIRDLLAATTASEIVLRTFSSVEDNPRTLTFALDDGPPQTIEVEGDTDWLDISPLVGGIDAALRTIGYARRFIGYTGPEFGQESGFAMLLPEEMRALLRFGLETNRRITLYLGPGKDLEPASFDYGDPEPWEQALAAYEG